LLTNYKAPKGRNDYSSRTVWEMTWWAPNP